MTCAPVAMGRNLSDGRTQVRAERPIRGSSDPSHRSAAACRLRRAAPRLRGLRGSRATPRCATSSRSRRCVADGLAALRSTEARAAWCAARGRQRGVGDRRLRPVRRSTRSIIVSYVFAHLGLVVLVAHQARLRWRTALALDGVIAGLAAAAVMTGFVSTAFEGTGVRVPATSLAGDAMIVTTIVLAFALSGWRPARAWWVIAAGEVAARRRWTCSPSTRPDPEPADAHRLGRRLPADVLRAVSPRDGPRRARSAGSRRAACRSPAGRSPSRLLMHTALTGGSRSRSGSRAARSSPASCARRCCSSTTSKLLDQTRADATTDKLTGLPNRRALTDDLDAALASGREHTLAFFDLDGFKEYNDTFGHPAGDALLQRLAAALGGYRLGGDEFCLLLPGALTRGRARDRARRRRAQRARRRVHDHRLVRPRRDPARGGDRGRGARARRRAHVRAQAPAAGDPRARRAAGARRGRGRGHADRRRARARDAQRRFISCARTCWIFRRPCGSLRVAHRLVGELAPLTGAGESEQLVHEGHAAPACPTILNRSQSKP